MTWAIEIVQSSGHEGLHTSQVAKICTLLDTHDIDGTIVAVTPGSVIVAENPDGRRTELTTVRTTREWLGY